MVPECEHVQLFGKYYIEGYVELPLRNVWKLESVQNTAVKMLTGMGHTGHIISVLAHLHFNPGMLNEKESCHKPMELFLRD